MKNKYRKIF